MEIKGKVPSQPIPTMNEAVSHLIESIASEEKALSRLLDTEAEHIRTFSEENLGRGVSSIEDIIKFNHSVIQFMDSVVMAEWMLLKKLDTVLQLELQGADGHYIAESRDRGEHNGGRRQVPDDLEDMRYAEWEEYDEW
ncbi:hypothetical protein ACFOQM_15850 [Paenibacillus sp. GCM10012307]|uniref:Uncharacterized protein n=1 Tax=Paenibacillus roseus TaxID=2798579 RepID=A0A934J6V8_9BACL|nr:hypothetical protein [Paenibacillus roseus]MBJ6362718.1 hypothetical protein [Paenibacillus roseus]